MILHGGEREQGRKRGGREKEREGEKEKEREREEVREREILGKRFFRILRPSTCTCTHNFHPHRRL